MDLTGITAAVEEAETVEASAATLLDQLSALIEANKTDPAALQALADGLKASSAALQAAIVKNTPAAG